VLLAGWFSLHLPAQSLNQTAAAPERFSGTALCCFFLHAEVTTICINLFSSIPPLFLHRAANRTCFSKHCVGRANIDLKKRGQGKVQYFFVSLKG